MYANPNIEGTVICPSPVESDSYITSGYLLFSIVEMFTLYVRGDDEVVLSRFAAFHSSVVMFALAYHHDGDQSLFQKGILILFFGIRP